MAPPRTLTGKPRGVRCTSCGADEWVRRRDRTRGWRCVPCYRRIKREWSARKARRLPAWTLWVKARERARRRGDPFTITVEDVLRAWPPDGRCPVFGMPLRAGIGKSHDSSPTLDRLNAAWGYEPGNVAVMSMKANRLKADATADELEQVAAWMRAQGLA